MDPIEPSNEKMKGGGFTPFIIIIAVAVTILILIKLFVFPE